MKKVVVLGSGNGSNFQAIAEYFNGKAVEFICISDKQDSFILKRAQNLGIESFFVPFDNNYKFLSKLDVDLFVLAGYMRILPAKVLKLGTFINIHPSLLPEFKGINAIQKAYAAKINKTGVTIHYVTDELDSGPIIEQVEVDIHPKMTLEKLEFEIHKTEHVLYPKVIERILFG